MAVILLYPQTLTSRQTTGFSTTNVSHGRAFECRLHRTGMSAAISVLWLILSFSPASASAGDCTMVEQQPENASISEPNALQSAQKAAINPRTRELDSPAALRVEDRDALLLERKLARQNITVTEHPDGSKSADLGDAYLTTLQARIVDGHVVTCHERNGSGQ